MGRTGTCLLLCQVLVVIFFQNNAVLETEAAASIGSMDPYGHFCPDVDPATQSPIAIVSLKSELVSPSAPLNMTWVENPLDVDHATGETILPGPVAVELAETTIYVHVPQDTYFFNVNGTNYSMVQMHLHIPAEHAVDGKRPMAELHIVHSTPSGELAVVGIMFNFARSTSNGSQVVETILNSIPQPQAGGLYQPGRSEYPEGLRFDTREWADIEIALAGSYFSYNGSLTTPPCTPGVNWFVMQDDWSLQISREQILRMETIIRNASGNYTSSNSRLPYVPTSASVEEPRVEFHVVPRGAALGRLKQQHAAMVAEEAQALLEEMLSSGGNTTTNETATPKIALARTQSVLSILEEMNMLPGNNATAAVNVTNATDTAPVVPKHILIDTNRGLSPMMARYADMVVEDAQDLLEDILSGGNTTVNATGILARLNATTARQAMDKLEMLDTMFSNDPIPSNATAVVPEAANTTMTANTTTTANTTSVEEPALETAAIIDTNRGPSVTAAALATGSMRKMLSKAERH